MPSQLNKTAQAAFSLVHAYWAGLGCLDKNFSDRYEAQPEDKRGELSKIYADLRTRAGAQTDEHFVLALARNPDDDQLARDTIAYSDSFIAIFKGVAVKQPGNLADIERSATRHAHLVGVEFDMATMTAFSELKAPNLYAACRFLGLDRR